MFFGKCSKTLMPVLQNSKFFADPGKNAMMR